MRWRRWTGFTSARWTACCATSTWSSGFVMQPLPTAGPASIEHELADQLGLDVTAFVETFDAGWCEAEVMHDFDADPSGGWESPFGPWYVAGRPAQLMLRVSHETIDLAVPHGEWYGVASLTLRPGHVVSLTRPASSAACAAVIEDLLGERRSSLFFCRYCRSLTPPEYQHDPDVCMGCASQWLGIVY